MLKPLSIVALCKPFSEQVFETKHVWNLILSTPETLTCGKNMFSSVSWSLKYICLTLAETTLYITIWYFCDFHYVHAY